jgi:hypothetical protein
MNWITIFDDPLDGFGSTDAVKKGKKKPNLSSIPCNMRQSIGLEPVLIDQSTHLDCEAN